MISVLFYFSFEIYAWIDTLRLQKKTNRSNCKPSNSTIIARIYGTYCLVFLKHFWDVYINSCAHKLIVVIGLGIWIRIHIQICFCFPWWFAIERLWYIYIYKNFMIMLLFPIKWQHRSNWTKYQWQQQQQQLRQHAYRYKRERTK